jgi:8-oxo-dGTP diphosphatase
VALPKGAWAGPDDARPLDAKGQRQVLGLIGWFASRSVDLVISSPAARCVMTVLPVANTHGVDLATRRPLLPGHLDEAEKLVKTLFADSREDGQHVALCTHGEVLPTLLYALGYQAGSAPHHAKGSVWTVDEAADGTTGFVYTPPTLPAPD